jgi:DNA mismatch repair ATPase MutS
MSSLCTLANQPCFDSEEAATSLKNFGKTLSFLWQFLASKEQILAMLTNVGFVDTMAACAKNITNETNPWCFTSFTTSKQPLLVATNFWHPLINGQAVKNNLTLGYQDTRPHAIITGPNEAGKSTTMKAIATLTLCSQTLGICSAESFVITPFTYIKTYLNINDDLGIGNSLFKAEIKRAQELIETIKNAPTNHFGLFVFDEMCSGTTPIEGAATAYSIAKQVGYFDNSLCLIATHFDILTRLGFETNRFTNFNVSALQQADGSFVYPRKLEEGISNQHIALDILRNEGFAGSLVDDATNIVRSISGLA